MADQGGISSVLAGQTSNNFTSILESLEMEKMVEGRGVRITFGTISMLLALYMVYRIWLDSWRSHAVSGKRENRYGLLIAGDEADGIRFAFLYSLHPAEYFPLILGWAIVVQQIIFISVQASALNDLQTVSCRAKGSVVLPSKQTDFGLGARLTGTAILMIGLLHFVFGLEMTVNCLRRTPFGRLPTWTPLVNVAIALVLYFGVVASSLLVGKSESQCFASITFLAASLRLNREMIGTLSAMMPILLVMAAVIAVQLLRTIQVEPCQRVAGTRMVFYLVLSVVQIVSISI